MTATAATVEPQTEAATSAELSPEELADRERVGDPQISPDGRAVAFTVAPYGKKEEHGQQAIWWSRDGLPAVKFTSGDHVDAAPRWSPDGKTLAFISNRKDKETSHLYLAPVNGGEAQRLGDLEGEFSDLRWSPDGTRLAVLRRDQDSEAEKKRKEEEKDDPVVYEVDAKRTRLWVVDVATGKARCLTHGERHVWEVAWSMDGERLVVVLTDEAVINALFAPASLWVLPVGGGRTKRVAEFPMAPSSPVVRAVDGQLIIAVVANDGRDDPSPSVWAVPLDGGDKRNLLPDHEGVVNTLVPVPGHDDKLAALIVERTHGGVYVLPADCGDLMPALPERFRGNGSVIDGPSLSADGKRLAFIWGDGVTPEEVYIADLGGEATAVSDVGKPFRDRLQRTEIVQWSSDDGVEVEGILVFPRDYVEGQRSPLVVQVHGGPSWQWEDRANLSWHDWAQMLASRGYAVLLPNPRGSTGYGSAFEKLLQDDVGGGESRDLVSGAKAMVERGIADPDRLGIAGWSWGGYLTAWTITQTDIFKAAVMGAGLANLISDHGAGDIPAVNLLYYPGEPYDHFDHYAARSPLKHVMKVKTPTLILHGENDARVHVTQGQEYYRALKTQGIPVQFVRYPREGHGIGERAHQIDVMRRIIDWFGRYLKSK
jgi:dipeptidyl aminopeptidase/acylaminoacyl peptidase